MPETQEKQIKMAELMSALSMASDLAEGEPLENSVKACYITMRLAEVLKLTEQERSDVFYTSLLQHVG